MLTVDLVKELLIEKQPKASPKPERVYNTTRLLRPERGLLGPEPNNADRALHRAEQACKAEGNDSPQVADLLEKMNRAERRSWLSEGKKKARQRAKRAAGKAKKKASTVTWESK